MNSTPSAELPEFFQESNFCIMPRTWKTKGSKAMDEQGNAVEEQEAIKARAIGENTSVRQRIAPEVPSCLNYYESFQRDTSNNQVFLVKS
jgi:hypothetical protein